AELLRPAEQAAMQVDRKPGNRVPSVLTTCTVPPRETRSSWLTGSPRTTSTNRPTPLNAPSATTTLLMTVRVSAAFGRPRAARIPHPGRKAEPMTTSLNKHSQGVRARPDQAGPRGARPEGRLERAPAVDQSGERVHRGPRLGRVRQLAPRCGRRGVRAHQGQVQVPVWRLRAGSPLRPNRRRGPGRAAKVPRHRGCRHPPPGDDGQAGPLTAAPRRPADPASLGLWYRTDRVDASVTWWL